MINHSNISEKTYDVLCEMIVTLKLPPGKRLVEEQLSRELGVSRTPLRQAINRLAQEGFIVIEPRKGASVRVFKLRDVEEVFEVRMSLEGLAARLAAGRLDAEQLQRLRREFSSEDLGRLLKADTELHKLVINNCGNNHLCDMLSKIYCLVQVFRVAGYGSKPRSLQATQDHVGIIDALIAGDFEQAEAKMRVHVDKTKQQIVKEFQAKQEQAVAGKDI